MSSRLVASRAREQVEILNGKLQDLGLQPVDAESFCILPFVHLSTATTGEIKLCCRSDEVSNIRSSDLTGVWTSEAMNAIRADLLGGVQRRECKSCWKLEKLGMVSLRMGQNLMRIEKHTARVVEWRRSKQVAPLQNVELKLSNLCNLKCRMCSPVASTPWMREWREVRDFYSPNDGKVINESFEWQLNKREPVLDHFMGNENFLRDFETIAESVEELEFAGGEPLLDPLHYDVLKKVEHRAKDIELKYSSNLMVLGVGKHSVIDLWPKFKSVKITISIDGPPELNEYIRTGSKTEVFEKNLNQVRAFGNVQLKGSTCVSAYNALFLPETLRYVSDLGISWYSNRVTSPRFLDARVWPKSLRQEAAAKLRQVTLEEVRKMSRNDQLAQLSYRTVEDCAAWLEDTALDDTAQIEFDKFKGYVRKLDGLRKTDFSGFFRLSPGDEGKLFAE